MKLFGWLSDPSHLFDRRLQACAVVVFCMVVILWEMTEKEPTALSEQIVGWAWFSLLSAVGAFQFARGLDGLVAWLAATTRKGRLP